MPMLKQFTARLDSKDFRDLDEIARSRGLKTVEVIRLAVAEFITNEKKRERAARQPLYGQGVGEALWMEKHA